MNDIDTARLIAYHDSMCSPGCGEDISTYPIPPDEWEPLQQRRVFEDRHADVLDQT